MRSNAIDLTVWRTHVDVSFPENTLDMALPNPVISDIMNSPGHEVIIY